MSETGRFPMYFSIIISVIKYLYRLENSSDGLLRDSYMCSKNVHNSGYQSWYSSAIFILKLLDLNISSCRNLTLSELVTIVKGKLINQYNLYWNQERDRNIASGKLDTYFGFKTNFVMEPYLSLSSFHHRRALCKLRISAHNLRIESERYNKAKHLTREERICNHCSLNKIENEIHFLTQCTLYNSERLQFFNTISDKNRNFSLLNDNDKANWLLMQENLDVLLSLAAFILTCLEKRTKS